LDPQWRARLGRLRHNRQLRTSTINTSNQLTVTGPFESQYVTFQGVSPVFINGQMTVDILNFIDNATTFNCPVTVNGSVAVNSNALVALQSSITFLNNGTFVLTNTANLNYANTSATFINKGIFAGATASVSTGTALFTNASGGSIIVSSGSSLQFQGTLASDGNFQPAANGFLYITSTTTLYDGALFTGTGVTGMVGNITNTGSALVTGNLQLGNLTNGMGANLTVSGLFEVSGGGGVTWYGGSLQGVGTNITGTIQIDSGANLVINQQNSMTIRNLVLANNGTVTCTNIGNVSVGYNAQINNNGKFYLAGDGEFETINSGPAGASLATFNNASGTLEKTQGATNSDSVFFFPVQGGTINVDQGTLDLDGGGSIDLVDCGGVLKLLAGTFTVTQPNATLEDYATPGGGFISGKIILGSAAILNLTGTLKIVSVTFEQDPGTQITGVGVLKVAAEGDSMFNWVGGTIALTPPGSIFIDVGSMTISGANNVKQFKSGSLLNRASIFWTGDNSAGGIQVGDGVTIINSKGAFICDCDAVMSDVSTNIHPVFTNLFGAFVIKTNSTGNSTFGIPLVNLGKIIGGSGTLEIVNYDDSQTAIPDFGIVFAGGTVRIDNNVVLHGGFSGSGTLSSGHGITNAGNVEADLVTVVGDLANDGNFELGDAPGILRWSGGGNFTQNSSGTLVVPIQGTNAATPDFGQLKMDPNFGFLTLAGTLQVVIENGYAPAIGTIFPIISSSQRTGTFSNVLMPAGMTLQYTSGGANVVITGKVPVQIISPQYTNGQFQFGFNTISNRNYLVQYTASLAPTNWLPFTNFTANGSFYLLTDTNSSSPQGFYRVIEP
jgi:hypothetical protein